MKILITSPFSTESLELIKNATPGCEIFCGAETCESPNIIVGKSWDKPFPRSLKLFQSTSAGVEGLFAAEIPDSVTVTNTTGAFGVVISEYVLAGILALSRNLFRYKDNQKRHLWQTLGNESMLFGRNALILGCGDLGSETAKKLRAFGTYTTGIRRSPAPAEGFDMVFGRDMLDAILPESDFVICCLPQTSETARMMDERRLRLMKQGAVFVNVGRGSVLDEDALIALLRSGSLSGAVLDVFRNEPLPEDSPLWDMENVLITPHISGPSFGHFPEVERAIADICADNIARYIAGKPLRNVVSRSKGYFS